MTAKMPVVGTGALLGGRGCRGRGKEDGREEGVDSPLETLRVLPAVVGDLVVSVLCFLVTNTDGCVSWFQTQMESVLSVQTIEKG